MTPSSILDLAHSFKSKIKIEDVFICVLNRRSILFC